MRKTQKLTLVELKSKGTISDILIANIEAIKGGADDEYCHAGYGKPQNNVPSQAPIHGYQDLHKQLDQFMNQYGPR